MQRVRVRTVCSQYKLQVPGIIIAVTLTESNPVEWSLTVQQVAVGDRTGVYSVSVSTT